jgi:YidC/Oxa1 family membrane protein insertase
MPANTPNAKLRRLVLTALLLVAVGGIGAIIILGKGQEQARKGAGDPEPIAAMAKGGETPAAPASDAKAGEAKPDGAKPADAAAATPATGAKDPNAPKLTARAPGQAAAKPAPIGSLDPAKARFQVTFAAQGAGVERVVFSEYWRTAAEDRQARLHAKGGQTAPALPADSERYELAATQAGMSGPGGEAKAYSIPLMAARVVEVDGQQVDVYGAVWAETAPGSFVTEIVDPAGAVQLRITRRWVLEPGSFDLRVEQRAENAGAAARTVRWLQFGPCALNRDANELVDTRRFQAGYLMSPERDPAQATVIAHGATLNHGDVVKQIEGGDWVLWPNVHQKDEKYGLSWFGSTNRYFALAVHAPYAPPTSDSRAIAPAVAVVEGQAGMVEHDGKQEPVVFTTAASQAVSIAPGKTAAFDVGVYAGPLDRALLTGTQPYSALNMQGLILYLMSGCCSWCTFSWLADFLVWFLGFLHNWVVFDWGLAIIVLVICVRAVLHPLTRRSQISMQRVTRQMAAIKPELEAIQKRHKDDPKKVQEETMRLYRERGVNPLGCAGGMLPTFLQMPIWIALYAVLYFAFELRQQPAFFGVFQNVGGWGFLSDLSSQDRFIPLGTTINLYVIQLSSINLIPILMGVVFWLQQKYMAPAPTANMTPEQESQQKMMKWMMVILFPFMLYSAPSGLTLYIATSTLVGIFESRRIKAEVDKMDFTKPQPSKPGFLGNVMQQAMQRAADAQKQQARNAPAKKFRDR